MGTDANNPEIDLVSRFRLVAADDPAGQRRTKEKQEKLERWERISTKNWSIPREKLEGLEESTVDVPFTINQTEYLAMRNHFEDSLPALKDGQKGLNRLAYRAYLLFGTPQKMMAYTKFCNHLNNQNLPYPESKRIELPSVAMMQAIDFPPAQEWKKINFRAWGQAFLEFGSKEIAPRFLKSSPYINPVRNSESHLSLLLTDFEASIQRHKDGYNTGKLEKLKILALKFGKNAGEFERMVKHSMQPYADIALRPEEKLPDLKIDGSRFGLPGTVFRKFSHNDPRILVIGDYTGCCERVTDEIHCLEKTVKQACTTNINAYYGVECDDEILAHSWAWRGKEGEMAFDGFESKDNNFNVGNMSHLAQAIAEEIADERYAPLKIDGFFIGQTAAHLMPAFVHHLTRPAAHIMPEHIRGKGMDQSSMWQIVKPMHLEPAVRQDGTPARGRVPDLQ